MVRITVDEKTSRELTSATSPVEICDAEGRLLGRFLPVEAESPYEGVEPPSTLEERKRAIREDERFTTEEVIERLQRREG